MHYRKWITIVMTVTMLLFTTSLEAKSNTFEGGSEEIEEDSKYESDIHADDWFTNSSKRGNYGFWEKYDETHTVIRFATSWATTEENTQKLIEVLKGLF